MRPALVQEFVTALRAAFDTSPLTAPARAVVDRVMTAADLCDGGQACVANGGDMPVTALLPQALAPLLTRGDALGELARALSRLAPDLVWTTRPQIGSTASPGFAGAHANCLVMGPKGMEPRGDIWLGISLMAPGTRYPDHDHAPEEVYLALSPGDFWHGDAAWITPGPGGTVHNLPGIRHAMRAGDAPFLAIWVLPVD